MPTLSLAEWFFLALGTAGFARFGWCLVYLIADEEPMPAWLDKALDVVVGLALDAPSQVRHAAAAALQSLVAHIEPRKGVVR
jgi:5-carboxymethyl-2-hydroxymuconate isomerase